MSLSFGETAMQLMSFSCATRVDTHGSDSTVEVEEEDSEESDAADEREDQDRASQRQQQSDDSAASADVCIRAPITRHPAAVGGKTRQHFTLAALQRLFEDEPAEARS